MSLADHACIPCRGGVPPLPPARALELLAELGGGWRINADGHLENRYSFANFVDAMAFAQRIADVAEAENHHPDLTVRWGECGVEVWTHKISGLTESDFFLAAKIQRLAGTS